MAHKLNIRAVIKLTLKKMLGSAIPLIFNTNLNSLYNYLVKLITIQEKYLMVDIMSLCQFFFKFNYNHFVSQ